MASITVSALKLKQACENYLAKREQRIEVERYELVMSYVGKRKYKWFGKSMDYTQAEEHVKKLDRETFLGGDWSRIEWVGYKQSETVKNLLKLAKAGDPVTLTDQDIWILDWL